MVKGDIMKVKPGTIHSVKNKDKQNAAANHYNMMIIDDTNEALLFTDSDLMKALNRASKNKEDIPKYTIDKSVYLNTCLALCFISSIGGGLVGWFLEFVINELM
jgi:hypothetical protein